MAHIFLSHRGADEKLAKALALELENDRHRIWLDTWNLRVGNSIIEWMNESLVSAKYVVVCYSSDDVLAPWMSREWMSALTRQLNGEEIRLLPVRLSGGQPPAILADIKYADLVADWHHGLDELLKALK